MFGVLDPRLIITIVNLTKMFSYRWDNPKYAGVDILLTSDWPKGITNNLPKNPDAVDDLKVGSALVSRLALLSRPRYHFSGLHGEHYERPPYRNHQSGSVISKHVTR